MTKSAGVERHFATVPGGRFGARQVHYRRAGSGPPVLMLHQSPLSSRDLLPAIAHFQGDFTCIAPDTPGYGQSDPFGVPVVAMEDIADAVVEFLDAIGIERVAVYGFHTGAMIGVALAARHPQRVICVATNGFGVFSPAEREDFLAHYLPPFVPAWDGSHLAWAWARLREQTIFFPWYRHTAAARMTYDVPPPEALQTGLVELLRAGDHYRVAYRAAFDFPRERALDAVRVPCLITAARVDPLSAHLARLGPLPPHIVVDASDTPLAALERCRQFLLGHAAGAPPGAALTRPLPGRLWSRMCATDRGAVRVCGHDAAGQRPLLVLSDAGSARDLEAQARRALGAVLTVDLPGRGDSDALPVGAEVGVDADATALEAVLDALGVRDYDVVGVGHGALLALEIARRAPARVRGVVVTRVPPLNATLRAELRDYGLPLIEPAWHGGHLLEAWHLVRDRALFWPGYRRNRDARVGGEPRVDPAETHARVVELLKAPLVCHQAHRAYLEVDVEAALRAVAKRLRVAAAPDDAGEVHSAEAARVAGGNLRVLPASQDDWATAARALLGD